MTRDSPQDRIDFPPFALYPRERRLTLHGKPIKIGARALDILVVLAARPGLLVSKSELMETVWPQQQIDESALRVHLSALRRVLGLAPGSAPSIVNETGRGYRFVVRHSEQAETAPAPAPRETDPAIGLPRPGHPLFGRDEAIAMLCGMLDTRRLVTLSGPGGVGKTALALATAHRHAAGTNRPAFFLDLAPLTDGRFLAAALSFALQSGDTTGLQAPDTERLRSGAATPATSGRSPALLPPAGALVVVDTCEHLLQPATELIERLLHTVPDLTVIATSREPLRAAGEWIYRLPPLALPPEGVMPGLGLLSAYPALSLFVERSGRATGPQAFGQADIPLISQICQHLDGLPLAIEMAAASLDGLSLEDVAACLGGRFQRLSRGRRTATPRQQTLSASIDWSYHLLTDDECLTLSRLCRVEKRFSLASAVAAAAGEDLTEGAAVDAVAGLVSKSLVLRAEGAGDAPYRLLNTVRAHVLAREAEDGLAAPAPNRAPMPADAPRATPGAAGARGGPLGFITFPGIHDVIRLDRIHPQASSGGRSGRGFVKVR